MAIRRRLKRDTERVIGSADEPALSAYLARSRNSGVRVNLNLLGEAVLGEAEARHRLDSALSLLDRPDVDYISVKISAVFSQINILAWEGSLIGIKNRLRPLFRAAHRRRKFINLDMEEYRDLELTLAAFQSLLDETEFVGFSAGVVLQAYLPDSWSALRRLTAWAKRRVAAGGVPIKVRLVKGANLAMETVEAELNGWPPAPYATKAETDANFRRMLEFSCRAENAAAVRVGVGSHNLFDIALALVLRAENLTMNRVEIEMLEGMAPHQARAVQAVAGGLLVYTPVVSDDDFPSALAYLIRRLDENTARGNFLRDLFALAPGSEAWQQQLAAFRSAWKNRHRVSIESRRHSAWRPPVNSTDLPTPARNRAPFRNEPNTDWTNPRARDLALAALAVAEVSNLRPTESSPVAEVSNLRPAEPSPVAEVSNLRPAEPSPVAEVSNLRPNEPSPVNSADRGLQSPAAVSNLHPHAPAAALNPPPTLRVPNTIPDLDRVLSTARGSPSRLGGARVARARRHSRPCRRSARR